MCSVGFCELIFSFWRWNLNVERMDPSQVRQALWVSHSMAALTVCFFLKAMLNKGHLCVYLDLCGIRFFHMQN